MSVFISFNPIKKTPHEEGRVFLGYFGAENSQTGDTINGNIKTKQGDLQVLYYDQKREIPQQFAGPGGRVWAVFADRKPIQGNDFASARHPNLPFRPLSSSFQKEAHVTLVKDHDVKPENIEGIYGKLIRIGPNIGNLCLGKLQGLSSIFDSV